MNASTQPDASWDWIELQLTKFLEAWESASGRSATAPPAVADYATTPADSDPQLPRLLVTELVKADIEFRLQSDSAGILALEQYLLKHPSLAPPSADLIHADFDLRRSAGLNVSPEDYYERFPQQAAGLAKLLGIDLPAASKTLKPQPRLPELSPGDRIEDFQLIALLGEGSFARVYLARQESMARMVALKISADRGREPQTLSQLDHPHIIRVFDQRILETDGMRLLYMEYAPGGTLRDVVARVRECPVSDRGGKLLCDSVCQSLSSSGLDATFPAELQQATWASTVCRIGVQLAQALGFAHAKGVLHRDIKPANVLLGSDGRPKLADFNVSFDAQTGGVAPAAYFGGSLAYMSPEQLRACGSLDRTEVESLDARSDLYSLAVLLWELLHGQRPYADEPPSADWEATVERMIRRREAGAPRGASGGDPLSSELQKTLAKCLAPDPNDRPSSGEVLARELHLCLEPHARRLLSPQHTAKGSWALRHPVVSLLLMVLLPNLLAAGLNLLFNLQWLEGQGDERMVTIFWRVQAVVNAIAFPIGVLLIVRLLRPIAAALGQGAAASPEQRTFARRQLLRVGPVGAWLGVALWSVCGLAYPITMHLAVGEFSSRGYLMFVADLVACGLIAASYPFFLASLLGIRVHYPHLLDLSQIPADEAAALQRMSRNSAVYLLIAGAVPMMALLLLAPLALWGQDIYKVALVGLAVAGFVGLVAAWTAHHRLQRDLEALGYAVRPIAPS